MLRTSSLPNGFRTALLALALAGATAAAPGCASDDDVAKEEAVELLQQGIEVGRAGDLERAAELFEQSEQTRPGFIDPLMFLANVHERLGDLEAARDAYKRALRSDPMFTDAGVALAHTFIMEQRFEEAREWLHRCIDVDPGSKSALFNLGAEAERAGDTEAALQWYRLAGVMDVWSTVPVLAEGRIFLSEGRIDDAKGAAERARARNPDDPRVAEFVEAVRAAEGGR